MSPPSRARGDGGFFLAIEGPSGVGKSTTLGLLADLLAAQGHLVHTTAEPSTSTLGEFTRRHADHLRGRALACLVAADRYVHVEAELRPLRDAGALVLCERYLASSLVLHRLDGVPERFVLDCNADILMPDLTVILTASPTVIAERLAGRGARHRFHRDPSFPAREVALYGEAQRTLEARGVSTVVVESSNCGPEEVARRIAEVALQRCR